MCEIVREHEPASSSSDDGYPATTYRNLGGTLFHFAVTLERTGYLLRPGYHVVGHLVKGSEDTELHPAPLGEQVPDDGVPGPKKVPGPLQDDGGRDDQTGPI